MFYGICRQKEKYILYTLYTWCYISDMLELNRKVISLMDSNLCFNNRSAITTIIYWFIVSNFNWIEKELMIHISPWYLPYKHWENYQTSFNFMMNSVKCLYLHTAGVINWCPPPRPGTNIENRWLESDIGNFFYLSKWSGSSSSVFVISTGRVGIKLPEKWLRGCWR